MNEDKMKVLERLRTTEELYVLMSAFTRMPYVSCDQETFDDEVFLFFDGDAAQKEAKQLIEAGNLVHIAKVEKNLLLQFYLSLYPLGVNCLHINKGTDGEMQIQHADLVTRGDNKTDENGRIIVENPEFHLTALYFIQEFKKHPATEVPEELTEIYDEMRAHFERGQYIVPTKEGEGIPLLKKEEGLTYFPLFTDAQEFQKFNLEGKFSGGILPVEKITEILPEDVVGVVVNPFGVNLMLDVQKQ